MNRDLHAIAIEQHAVPAILYGVVTPAGITSLYFSIPVARSFIEAGSYSYGVMWMLGSAVIAVISVGCAGRSRREWRSFKAASAAAHVPKSKD